MVLSNKSDATAKKEVVTLAVPAFKHRFSNCFNAKLIIAAGLVDSCSFGKA